MFNLHRVTWLVSPMVVSGTLYYQNYQKSSSSLWIQFIFLVQKVNVVVFVGPVFSMYVVMHNLICLKRKYHSLACYMKCGIESETYTFGRCDSSSVLANLV